MVLQIHPNTQNIIESWSNPYDFDKAENDHGIVAYKDSIRDTIKEIAKDAYERMKKE